MPPELSTTDREERVDQAIADYLAAREAGEQLDAALWLRHHPDLTAELTSFLADKDRFERFAGPLCPAGLAQTPRDSYSPRTEATASFPRRFGEFELLEELGRGGMGVVYRARQKSVHRVVALKTIRDSRFASAEEQARFQAEAVAVASLDHPHIVSLYEVGQHEGQPYFAMQLIEGRSLAEVLQDKPLDPKAAAWLLATVARAVYHAHERGVLHRDLKPANILLDVVGQPHVADFGLAKQLVPDGMSCSHGLTQSFAILGTPHYLSPEQASGQVRHLGVATDVYALGAILYEMLTGRPPFVAETPLALFRQILDDEPIDPRASAPQVDRDLETICLKCLEKEPHRRYASAAALADDLDRWLRNEPIAARPSGVWIRTVKWAKRRPAVAVLSAALALASILLVVALVLQLNEARASLRASNDRAEALRKLSEQQEREVRVVAAHQALRTGMAEVERGEIGPGLLWLVRGLENTPDDERNLQRSLRLLISGWARELHPIRNSFPVTPAFVPHVAFSPDGKLLARGGSRAVSMCPPAAGAKKEEQQVVELWQIETGKLLGEPIVVAEKLSALAFSPDGKILGVECEKTPTRYFDVATGKPNADGAKAFSAAEEKPQLGLPDGALVLDRSRDGKLALLGLEVVKDRAETAQLWDVSAGKLRDVSLKPGFRIVVGRLVYEDGAHVVLAGEKEVGQGLTLAVAGRWATNGNQIGRVAFLPGRIQRVVSPAHGTVLLVGGDDGRLRLWDMTGERFLGEPIPTGEIGGTWFSPDGRLLFTDSDRGTGRVHDTVTGRPHGDRLRGGQGGVDEWEFTPDSRRIINCAGLDVRLINLAPLVPGRLLPGNSYFTRACFAPNGRRILAGMGHVVEQWDAETARPIGEPIPHPKQVVQVECGTDGKTFFSITYGDRGYLFRLWDAVTRRQIGDAIALEDRTANEATHHFGSWVAPRYSPDGRLVLFVEDEKANVWDATTGKKTSRVLDHQATILHTAFSPDGRTLFTAGLDGRVRRWNWVDGTESGTSFTQEGPVLSLGMSPDGKRMVTTASGPPELLRSLAHVWDLESGEKLGEPIAHANSIGEPLRFSSDSLRLLGKMNRDQARLWDAKTGKPCVARPLDHGRQIDDVHFSPDGSLIVTAGLFPNPDEPGGRRPEFDRTRFRLWDAGTGKPLGSPLVSAKKGNAWARFSPDGKRLLLGLAEEMRLLDAPRVLEGDAERLRLWIEVCTGLELDAGGAVQHFDSKTWQERRRRLEELGGPLMP